MTGTLKIFTLEHIASQKCSHDSAELGLYLVRFVKSEDCQLGVQED
jgi:hypothetical protein